MLCVNLKARLITIKLKFIYKNKVWILSEFCFQFTNFVLSFIRIELF